MRTRGVVAGVVALAAGPIVALSVAGGHAGRIISPVAATSADPGGHSASTAGSFRVARIPELHAQEAEPTPVPTPVPTATPTPTPTPTPAPTPTATRAPARSAVPAPASAPVNPGSIEGIIRAAAAAHGVSGDWMVKIARCESGLNPRAYNPAGPYIGLFQFLQSTFRAHGGTDIYDPYQQSDITATMLAQGQARQWGCA